MIKKVSIVVFALMLSVNVIGQKKITWDWIQKHVRTEEKFYEDEGIFYLGPVFDKELLALEGEEIIITGYVMPLDKEADYYCLSANSYARCYFCGGAGQETIMTLNFINKDLDFNLDEFITVKGKLRLNADDFEEMFLILDDAQLYSDL